MKVEVWASVPNKPTVPVDVKQHSAQQAESRTVAKLGSDSRVSCMPVSFASQGGVVGCSCRCCFGGGLG